MSACVLCGSSIGGKNKSGKCRSCAAKTRAPARNPAPRVAKCADCGEGITAKAVTGRCKSCATIYHNRLPETSKKRIEGWKKRLAIPGERERLARQAKRNCEKALTDPEIYQRFAERGRYLFKHYLDTPEVRAKIAASRKRAGAKVREKLLAWCPVKYRDLHRENMARHRMTAAQSREMITKLAADDEAIRHVNSALDYLRRLAPVQKLENGYRYGNAVLRPAEVIARAKLRGWQPERWAA